MEMQYNFIVLQRWRGADSEEDPLLTKKGWRIQPRETVVVEQIVVKEKEKRQSELPHPAFTSSDGL